MSFKKGESPIPHKEKCTCFRCSGVAWNKGAKRWWNSPSWKKGNHPSPDTEIKKGQHLSKKTEYKNGSIPWSKLNKGKMPKGKNHWEWKGDKVGYFALHNWIKRNLGSPKECKKCGSKSAKRYEWANISRKYKRAFSDWVRLCKSCHEKYDKGGMRL